MTLVHCTRTDRIVRPGLVLFAAAVLGSASASAQTRPTLKSRLMPWIEGHSGRVAVAVRHLETGEEFNYNADAPMPTASLIKLPIMAAVYQAAAAGKLELDMPIELRAEDKVPGSGILTKHFSPGARISLRDAIRLMIAYSDNTATNLVIDQIGLEATTAQMSAWGYPQTRLYAKVYRRETSLDPQRSREFGLGSTTASEMVRLLAKLQAGELVSAEAAEAMLDHLRNCEDKTKLARFLPADTVVAHKSGAVTASRCDAGIIESPAGPIAVCVLTADNEDTRWTDDNAALLLCGHIARDAYAYFNPDADGPPSLEQLVLQDGAQGTLVMALQRTLNARLAPSPELGVDGEFGPATRAAVMRLQQDHGLPADGVVRADTWAALGPLQTKPQPIPEPDEVNLRELPRQPVESLHGPPAVTCKAWVVGDATSGEILYHERSEEPLDIASTTKIMTAWVVLKLVAAESAVIDEEILVSVQADEMPGSTADIHAGERIPVSEMLYGLLLPSGNDAAIALAEHFGERFPPAAGLESAGSSSYDRFIAEMNREAARLGMTHTHFENPHGWTAAHHKASAADLFRLATVALRNELFCNYVSTRQRGYKVRVDGGYERNLIWKNTNRLLPIEGYDGVKTGTTTAAGACLVASARRDDRHLVAVVLGSAASTARYADTRNLLRWAWQEIEK